MDSLHEHLNSPCAASGTYKLNNGDDIESFSQSESSDVDAEFDNVACTEGRLASTSLSTPENSLGSVWSHNEQSLLETGTEDSSGFIDTHSVQSSVTNSTASQHCADNTDTSGSVILDESGRKVPSIEDFCSKDTKTLNTNVLIAETTEELATDSEKFHKMENTTEHAATSDVESLDGEVTTSGQLHELLLAACDGSVSKPVKETNLVANWREKFVDSMKMATHSVAAYALTSATDVDCFITAMKQYCGKPDGVTQLTTEPDDDAQNYDSINNIKRIKIDDQAEKNLRMQAKLKVNTEQNQTRLSSSALVNCTATNATAGDQLIDGSSSPVTVSTASSHVVQSPASCTGDVVAARHVRRAEKAWLAYTSRNRSVIVDTFQGQFKSTVSNAAFLLTYVLLVPFPC